MKKIKYNYLIEIVTLSNGIKVPTGRKKINSIEDIDYIPPQPILYIDKNIYTSFEVSYNSVSKKWRVTGYLDRIVNQDINIVGNFRTENDIFNFHLIIPKNMSYGVVDVGKDISKNTEIKEKNIDNIDPDFFDLYKIVKK